MSSTYTYIPVNEKNWDPLQLGVPCVGIHRYNGQMRSSQNQKQYVDNLVQATPRFDRNRMVGNVCEMMSIIKKNAQN